MQDAGMIMTGEGCAGTTARKKGSLTFAALLMVAPCEEVEAQILGLGSWQLHDAVGFRCIRPQRLLRLDCQAMCKCNQEEQEACSKLMHSDLMLGDHE